MIEFVTGNLLNSKSEALVNTVNCVGIMGKGIALQFRQAYPDMFEVYAKAAEAGNIQPGRMFVYEASSSWPGASRYVINFPTKRHWREKSRIEDIDAGLTDLVATIRRLEVKSVAIPRLGTGLGGLDWTDVRSHVVAALECLPDVHTRIYSPET
jgi:O-acetyl-ADP-ribose deacetylase (regulator of RNase III)